MRTLFGGGGIVAPGVLGNDDKDDGDDEMIDDDMSIGLHVKVVSGPGPGFHGRVGVVVEHNTRNFNPWKVDLGVCEGLHGESIPLLAWFQAEEMIAIP
jgi:hypothetical protein